MILIIGERANLYVPPRRKPIRADLWYHLALKSGAFARKSHGLERLHSIGVLRYDHTMNLNPPGRREIGFDYHLADQVAALIRDDDRWTRVVLCGRRVARCFGIDWRPYWGALILGRYLVVPHPSLRSRWWNRSEERDLERILARELTLRSLISEDYVTGRCKLCDQPLIELDTQGLCPAHEVLI